MDLSKDDAKLGWGGPDKVSTEEDVINEVGIDCEIGSIPILILFAFSASFSHALARSCSARTLVRCGGDGRCKTMIY